MVMHPEEEDLVSLVVEFTGGLELLFSNQRKHSIALPRRNETDVPVNIAYLVHFLVENVMVDRRKDMFLLNGTVRPGILVLINDADWELEGTEQYNLQENDTILFVSTLHGG